jgi:hypothetical protein
MRQWHEAFIQRTWEIDRAANIRRSALGIQPIRPCAEWSLLNAHGSLKSTVTSVSNSTG